MKEEILDKGLVFARKEYALRQSRCWNGDPTGFAVLYNMKSKKFTITALNSKKLLTKPESSVHVYNVYGNGSCEEV